MNIVIDNNVWCELEIEGSICKYKFFLLNIPCFIGGHKKTRDGDDCLEHNWHEVPSEVIEGMIFCDSNEDAKQCAMSINRLIRSGYEERQGDWFIGMDMADVFIQFNGEPMKFIHRTFEHSFDEESLIQIQKKINDANCVFHYFLSPKNEVNKVLYEVDDAYEKVLPEGDSELIWQLSILNDCKRTVSIWYR